MKVDINKVLKDTEDFIQKVKSKEYVLKIEDQTIELTGNVILNGSKNFVFIEPKYKIDASKFNMILEYDEVDEELTSFKNPIAIQIFVISRNYPSFLEKLNERKENEEK